MSYGQDAACTQVGYGALNKAISAPKAIPSELQSTRQALTNLEEFAAQLIARVSPVSRATAPTPVGVCGGKSESYASGTEIGTEVSVIGDRIRSLTSRIQDAIELLEI